MVELIEKYKSWVAVVVVFAAALVFSSYVSAQSAPQPTKPGSSLEQRVAQRKVERKVKLDALSTTRYEGSCVRAQTTLRQLRDEYVAVIDKRKEIYRKVDAKLWVAIGNLKYVNKDTFKLEQQRTELLRQTKGFEAASDEFRQLLDDISTMNCAADIIGFQAMIETARLYNTQIRNRSDGITDQVVNKIKPIISGHANELRPKASQE